MGHAQYDAGEEALILEALRRGKSLRCPRCGGAVGRRAIQPEQGVAYVRRRVWLSCEGCGRNLVLDERRARNEP